MRLWLPFLLFLAACAHHRPRSGDPVVDLLAARHVDGALLTAEVRDEAGALAALKDPHARILNAPEAQALRDDLAGLPGPGLGLPELLGVDVGPAPGTVAVIVPQPDSPAARAGLAPGDLLIAIDGQPLSDLPFSEVLKLLRIPPGRSIALALQHEGSPRAVTLSPVPLRAVQAVEGLPQGDTLTLRLTRFSDSSATAVQALLTELKPARVIVDLRGNPGGGLEAALTIAAALSGPGAVAQVTLREGEEPLEARGPRLFQGPLEVWVDGGTASAAELLALALADRGAVLKGTKTYGRCLAFALEELPDGRSLFFTFGRMHAREAQPWCATGLSPSARVP